MSRRPLLVAALVAATLSGVGAAPASAATVRSIADGLPISVPNHRAVPRLALWLDIRPSRVVSAAAEEREPRTGYFLAPARPFTIRNFILDPGDPGRVSSTPPPGFSRVAANRSWELYRRCAEVAPPVSAGPGPAP